MGVIYPHHVPCMWTIQTPDKEGTGEQARMNSCNWLDMFHVNSSKYIFPKPIGFLYSPFSAQNFPHDYTEITDTAFIVYHLH